MRPSFPQFHTCPTCRSVVDAPGAYCHRCTSKVESAVIFKFCAWGIVILLCLAAVTTKCKGSVITEDFLDRIAQIESGNRNGAIGAQQERGAYQLKWCAVQDYNEAFGKSVKHKEVHNGQVGRSVARGYLVIIERRLTLLLRRPPNQSELYAAYNRGVAGFVRKRK